MLVENFIIISCTLSICISSSFILFVICASSIHSLSIALTCHSTIAVIITNIFLLLTAIFMLNINTLNNFWCQINAYCFQASLILIYHSYCLQAFHRFLSVVYHNKIFFRRYHLFLGILIFQWIFAWLYPLRLLLVGLFTYNPFIHVCHLNWSLTHELLLLLSVGYLIPLTINALFYISLIKHSHLHIVNPALHSLSHHRQVTIIYQEQRRIKRELKMIKRIIVFFLILLIMNCPSLILTSIPLIGSYNSISLNYSYRFILFCVSCTLLFLSICQFILTPTVKLLIHEFFKRRTNRVFP